MGKRLFVGNLSYEATEAQIREPFAGVGSVTSVKLIMDRETGRFKGFAFVEMSTDAEAAAAIEKLNNSMVGTRKMIVSEARPPAPRTPGQPFGSAPRTSPGFGPAPRSSPGGGGRPDFGSKPDFGPPSREFGKRGGGKGRDGRRGGEKERERERTREPERKGGGGSGRTRPPEEEFDDID